MNIKIRKEDYNDYRKIAEINALAFSTDGYIGEVALIDGLRHCTDFDRDLSLVAELDGKVVGHVLFYPFDTVINNKLVKSVCLAPLAITPEYQKYGIGGMLINEGHKIAKEKGYTYSFLYGYSSYYPKFGYITNVFGDCFLEIQKTNIDKVETTIEEREVKLEDIDLLMEMWKKWHGNVDLALKPSKSILDWISHTATIKTSVIVINGEVQGYLRYNENNIEDIRMFLAKDKIATEELIKYIAMKLKNEKLLRLPIHPDSTAINMLDSFSYKVDLQKWDVGMIKILDEENKDIRQYCNEVLSEKRNAGKIIFTPSYDMA